MRYLFLSLLLLAAVSLHGEEPPEALVFVQKVTKAVNNQDYTMIRQNTCEVDVPQNILDQTHAAWEQFFSGKYPEEGWRFDRCSFIPLDSLKVESRTAEENVLSEHAREALVRSEKSAREIYAQFTKPFMKNGQLYEYNLKVIGVIILHFKNDNRETGRMMPVGIIPTGDIGFTLLKETKS